ncbi:MAG: hypothetical protein HYV07_16120 [Deltaproteobacteria bacterium]|nr:hypothetical protein [Deltaproteobacteria bacterium]
MARSSEDLQEELLEMICRGTYQLGDELPPPADLARSRLLNPRRVLDAYGQLTTLGVLLHFDGDQFVVAQGGTEAARRAVTARTVGRLEALIRLMKRSGLSDLDVDAAFEAAKRGSKAP